MEKKFRLLGTAARTIENGFGWLKQRCMVMHSAPPLSLRNRAKGGLRKQSTHPQAEQRACENSSKGKQRAEGLSGVVIEGITCANGASFRHTNVLSAAGHTRSFFNIQAVGGVNDQAIQNNEIQKLDGKIIKLRKKCATNLASLHV